uniref:hypothetical protein n=1 Tax=Acidovorax sp. SUPP3334 TaxID=2920881 RepID=UPI0029529568|nr:hypothetical protein [Acidovorax sp. SUPP3334]BDH38369.1 hypothetical protein AVHM3334_23220 [Acidovorax sp. SUPP3334]
MSNVEELISWLGVAGAVAGLESSDLTIAELLDLAPMLSANSGKLKRADLIRTIVSTARERMTKSPEELMSMDTDAVRAYFHDIKASRDEILAILEKLDIRPGSAVRQSLFDFAAREITEIGMYTRVAKGHRKD